MTRTNNTTPKHYSQPISNIIERKIKDSVEDVDFVPGTGIRIWYNTETDGYPLHKHGAIEIVTPIEGIYTYTAGNKRFTLNPGDILFIPPNMLHEVISSDAGARFLFLLDIDFMKRFLDYSSIEEFLSEAQLVNHKTQPKLYDNIYSKLMDITDIYFKYTDYVRELPIFADVLSIFSYIAEEQYLSLSQNKSEEENKFAGLITYINEHYMDDLTLDFAATYVNFSKFHFSRKFKEYTNCSFYDYLSKRRIQAAKIKLINSNDSITDIALQCGFNNPATFTRCFQKYVDSSPSEYRIALRKDR
jgi:AraC-like DNA-binding protein